jgi:anti-sigma regulatory factor (Ser/Thr protein kinase)
MPTVTMQISPDPAHVRTVRLVTVAAARRAGVPDELLDEVRLAVGEACSRAVALHRALGVHQLVRLDLTDDAGFTVEVRDSVPQAAMETLPGHAGLPGEDLASAVRLVDVTGDAQGLAANVVAAVRPVELGPGRTVSVAATETEEQMVAAGMGIAVLSGLVDDVEVGPAPDGPGTVVRMSWPARRPGG